MSALTLRLCRPEDARALRLVAERDSAAELAGPALGAEAGGDLVAAICLRTGRVIADPFVPTADAVELLRQRAAQIGRAVPGRESRLARTRRLLTPQLGTGGGEGL